MGRIGKQEASFHEITEELKKSRGMNLFGGSGEELFLPASPSVLRPTKRQVEHVVLENIRGEIG